MTDRTESRLPWVDALRGLSILAVVLLHIDIRIPISQSAVGAVIPREVSRVLFRSGFYGVKVFFVISGFLITTTILRRWQTVARVDVKAFYQLRFARIAPCLLALVAVLCLLHLAAVPGFVVVRTSLGRAVFAALTFHLNVLEIAVGYLPAAWDVLWSLSVEEVFYLTYPLLLRFVRPPLLVVASGLLLIVVGPLARTVWAGNAMAEDYGYLAGFDCIALGCLAAVAVRRRLLPAWALRTARGVGAALALLVVVFRGSANYMRLGRLGLDVTVLALGTALFLWGVVGLSATRPSSAGRWSAPLRWLGQHSYEVYLTHSFVMIWGAQLFQALGSPRNTTALWHVAMAVTSAILGWLVARTLSEPANRLLRARFTLTSPEPELTIPSAP